MGKQTERIVNADRVDDLIAVFGSFDENIKRIEEALEVQIINRGTDMKVSGDEENVDKAVRTLEGLLALAAKGELIDEQKVRYLITLVQEGNDSYVTQMAKDVVCITAKGKPIKAKTVGQQSYMKAIQKNTITIVTQLKDPCPILILEDDLYQIIFNLVENGIKYNVPGGKLTIRVYRDGENGILEISDTGVGIPADAIGHVFERFYRVDKSHSRDIGGTGLGLSIVKHGAAFHGAEVQLESREGEGTTVRVLF